MKESSSERRRHSLLMHALAPPARGPGASFLDGFILLRCFVHTIFTDATLQVVLSFWKEFNLDGRRLQLDKQVCEGRVPFDRGKKG